MVNINDLLLITVTWSFEIYFYTLVLFSLNIALIFLIKKEITVCGVYYFNDNIKVTGY